MRVPMVLIATLAVIVCLSSGPCTRFDEVDEARNSGGLRASGR